MQVTPPRKVLLLPLGHELEGLSDDPLTDITVKLAEFRLAFPPKQVDDDSPFAGEEVNVRGFVVVRVDDHSEGAFSVDGGQRSAPYDTSPILSHRLGFCTIPIVGFERKTRAQQIIF